MFKENISKKLINMFKPIHFLKTCAIRLYIFLGILLFSFNNAYADEGLWLPLLLEKLNQKDMQMKGLKITARDIYDVNHSSLKDAIVQFGGGCTAEVVSDQGLLLTNHHCGYGYIQRHSSIQQNYLEEGFWASTFKDELPCPGLKVSFLIEMRDVSQTILDNLRPDMDEKTRVKTISEISEQITKEAIQGTHYKAEVESFYNGNQFYLFIYEVFRDVRLVGAPPSSIGKFGGDTDNWMWPRHTGDFSVFRIYADTNNLPADYNPNNQPYKPRRFLPISLKGIEKGDFTFVYGYPGSTQEYLPSFVIRSITESQNPVRIHLRDIRLRIMDEYMKANKTISIQYAAKSAGIANGWKKWMGENRGIKRINAISRKQDYERKFSLWAQQGAYHRLLPLYEKKYQEYANYRVSEIWLSEAAFGVEILSLARSFQTLIDASIKPQPDTSLIRKAKKQLLSGLPSFYKNYNSTLDFKMMEVLLDEYQKNRQNILFPSSFDDWNKKYGSRLSKIFDKSLFLNQERLLGLLKNYKPSDAKKILKDPIYELASSFASFQKNELQAKMKPLQQSLDSLQRIYMKAQMEMEPDRLFYPDANSTLRIAYGNILDYYPRDAVHYLHQTTLNGVIEKEDSTIADYQVPIRLKQLYEQKDFGRYADKSGKMPVAFIANNHTSGGNSGSPVLNAEGQLIGINFDRNWEGTMSDLMYDPNLCRNITLDIRYCLFIIDKYAQASRLIDEMSIIQ